MGRGDRRASLSPILLTLLGGSQSMLQVTPHHTELIETALAEMIVNPLFLKPRDQSAQENSPHYSQNSPSPSQLNLPSWVMPI